MDYLTLIFYLGTGVFICYVVRQARFYLIARQKVVMQQVNIERNKQEEIKIETLFDNIPLMLANQIKIKEDMLKRGATDLQLKPLEDQIALLERVQKYEGWIRPFSPIINPIVNKMPELIERLISG